MWKGRYAFLKEKGEEDHSTLAIHFELLLLVVNETLRSN